MFFLCEVVLICIILDAYALKWNNMLILIVDLQTKLKENHQKVKRDLERLKVSVNIAHVHRNHCLWLLSSDGISQFMCYSWHNQHSNANKKFAYIIFYVSKFSWLHLSSVKLHNDR